MEKELKTLMERLGEAINDSLGESERIAEAIEEIRRAGYDLLIVLKSTIRFSKREKEDEEKEKEQPKQNMTERDKKFLRALKIDINDL